MNWLRLEVLLMARSVNVRLQTKLLWVSNIRVVGALNEFTTELWLR